MSTALEDLEALLAGLPGYALISDGMKESALAIALVPDENGVWPGEPGYIPTYDVYFAALSIVPFLAAQPVVRSSSSEGTSVAIDATNWSQLASYYKSMSPILQVSGSNPLTKVLIPDGPHVHAVDMSWRVGDYDNVDTDLG